MDKNNVLSIEKFTRRQALDKISYLLLSHIGDKQQLIDEIRKIIRMTKNK